MNIKNKTYQLFTYLLFAITTLYSFSISQLYYLTSKGPDYDFYKPYFDYFFGRTGCKCSGQKKGLVSIPLLCKLFITESLIFGAFRRTPKTQ